MSARPRSDGLAHCERSVDREGVESSAGVAGGRKSSTTRIRSARERGVSNWLAPIDSVTSLQTSSPNVDSGLVYTCTGLRARRNASIDAGNVRHRAIADRANQSKMTLRAIGAAAMPPVLTADRLAAQLACSGLALRAASAFSRSCREGLAGGSTP